MKRCTAGSVTARRKLVRHIVVLSALLLAPLASQANIVFFNLTDAVTANVGEMKYINVYLPMGLESSPFVDGSATLTARLSGSVTGGTLSFGNTWFGGGGVMTLPSGDVPYLTGGEAIGPNPLIAPMVMSPGEWYFANNSGSGPWDGSNNNGYVGFGFTMNGGISYNYGWASFSYLATASGSTLTLNGLAYNTVAGAPILAGEMPTATPEPGAFALAGFGLLGLFARRMVRRRA